MYLNPTFARYLAPSDPTPSAADLSAAYWIACSGTDLLVAAVITDSIAINGVGEITVGDAAQILVDGLNDGITRPGQDDHDVFVNPAGTALAYNRPIPGATLVARATPASNWRFEIRIPFSSLWAGILPGSEIGYTIGLWDNDTTPTPNALGTPGPDSVDRVMVGSKWSIKLPTPTP